MLWVCVLCNVRVGDEMTGSSDVSETTRMSEELESLRAENIRLTKQLQQQRDSSRHSLGGDCVQLDFIHAQQELSRCKEALIGSLLTYLLTYLLIYNQLVDLPTAGPGAAYVNHRRRWRGMSDRQTDTWPVHYMMMIITVPRSALYLVQSAVLRSRVVCLSVCMSVCLWRWWIVITYRLEVLETNCTDCWPN